MRKATDSGALSTLPRLLGDLAQPYLLFWRHRQILADTVKQILRGRFAGSLLGLAWLVVGPLILLGLYAVLYTVVFRIRPVGMDVRDYILYIFAGLVPFIAFGQALAAGSNSLATDRALLLNRLFPAELIPAREVLAAGTVVIVGCGMIILIKTLLGEVSWTWLFIPPILLLLAMMTMGIVWGFSIANLIVKDVQQLVGYIVMILLIASPIAYTPDMVPPTLRILLYANPFAYYVQSLQSVLVLGQPPSAVLLGGCLLFALVSFHGMFRAFSVGKRIIADHI
jgi:lipopolysaccharide transport system permease protein